jgi:hypothetical protein
MPDDQVLLSDFDLWHYVLNRWYLPQRACERREEIRSTFLARSMDSRMQSWQRIFELDWYLKDVTSPRSKRSIQATIWQLPLSAVRSVAAFRAR